MNTNTAQFKVRLGLFVVIGFIIFALGIFLIGRQKHLFDPIFKLTTTFYNISGLQVGKNVRFSGIDVGTVDNINIINDSTVRVDMIVKKSIQPYIKSDCQATIGSEGIIGDKILIITQGSSMAKTVKDGQYIKSVEPVEMESIIRSLNSTAQNAEVISQQLIEVMDEINHGNGTIGRLIRDPQIANELKQSIVNLKESGDGISNTMEAVNKSFLFKGYFKKKAEKAKESKQEKTDPSKDKVVPKK